MGSSDGMQVVLFDLDGVIADTAKYHFLAWKHLSEKIGVTIDEEFNEQLKGISRMESLERILELGQKSDQYSLVEKEKMADDKNELYIELIQTITPEDALPQIPQVLASLKDKEIKIGLASASKNGPLLLDLLGLTEFFDCIVDPTSVVAGKPAPDIFLKGSELLGVQPSQCVGIEDASAGVWAIKDAGMTAIAIGDVINLAHADKVLSSTCELTSNVITQVWHENHK
ncbi:beta-phosphoglucomutase [Peribacillus loiseleuriae]|uniref:Beta-phosphoglucomutase n=2 Tax=Peribacillus loiseleuriae TaxID=1679170 RepID=A0A0K9GU73_9BACI|nr:beta-phosphoglucomutase [Peribacillus loiseleuriae]